MDPPDDEQFMEWAIWQPEILCFRKPAERGFLDYMMGLHPNLAKQIPYADTDLLKTAKTAEQDWIHNRDKMAAKYKSPIDFIANYCDVSPQARRA